MPDVRLPLDASADEIAGAIRTVQARCRSGVCADPDALAQAVRGQLDRGELAARALGLTLAELHPDLQAWEARGILDNGDLTVVHASRDGIVVRRGVPWATRSSGHLDLHLRPAGR